MISVVELIILGGRTSRAILSMQSPIAMSVVVARMEWVVRAEEYRRRVWPPETRRERKGKAR